MYRLPIIHGHCFNITLPGEKKNNNEYVSVIILLSKITENNDREVEKNKTRSADNRLLNIVLLRRQCQTKNRPLQIGLEIIRKD